ncbi:MAG: lipocalin family protein [Bacteroidales bacterium]|nr:lipocalin family protein [Bacteroidales bacterium]
MSGTTLRIYDESDYCYDTYTVTYLDDDTLVLKGEELTYSYERVTKSGLPFSISDIVWD